MTEVRRYFPVLFGAMMVLLSCVSGLVIPSYYRGQRLYPFIDAPLFMSDPKVSEDAECQPCAAAAAKREEKENGASPNGGESDGNCDLRQQLKEDIEAGYARRYPQEEAEEVSPLTSVTQSIINNTFVRSDTSSLRSILLNRRSYARPQPFEKENLRTPPAIEDLLPEPTKIRDSFYLSAPSAIIVFVASSAVFPLISEFCVNFITIPPEYLDNIVSKLAPGIAILYGTFMSLTLSILYNRQRFVQDNVSQETSLLSFLLHNMVSLFRRDRNRMVRSGQAAADQVRILLKESRGIEYMTIIYTDPYIKMLELIEEEEERLVEEHGDFLSKGPVLGTCRDTIRELRKIRASRLSDEGLALPPTHFFILRTLTSLILLGYFISVLPAVDELGYTPIESTLLFGTLSTVYLLFYWFANDLNDLYNGVFQVRRGCSASHLLEIKKLVSDHPWLRFEVNFERVNSEVRCFYPGLAELWFENEQNFGSGL